MSQGTTNLAVISSSDQIAPFTSRIDAERLVKIFLSNKSELTIAAYRKDLADFARFLGVEDSNLDHAARLFLSNGRGGANAFAAGTGTDGEQKTIPCNDQQETQCVKVNDGNKRERSDS